MTVPSEPNHVRDAISHRTSFARNDGDSPVRTLRLLPWPDQRFLAEIQIPVQHRFAEIRGVPTIHVQEARLQKGRNAAIGGPFSSERLHIRARPENAGLALRVFVVQSPDQRQIFVHSRQRARRIPWISRDPAERTFFQLRASLPRCPALSPRFSVQSVHHLQHDDHRSRKRDFGRDGVVFVALWVVLLHPEKARRERMM